LIGDRAQHVVDADEAEGERGGGADEGGNLRRASLEHEEREHGGEQRQCRVGRRDPEIDEHSTTLRLAEERPTRPLGPDRSLPPPKDVPARGQLACWRQGRARLVCPLKSGPP
jgi:hypothetical protein